MPKTAALAAAARKAEPTLLDVPAQAHPAGHLTSVGPPPPDLAALERVEVTDDVVHFAFECIMALAPGFNQAVIEAAERHVRATYGNQEVWIRLRRDLQRRNQQIVREYLAGERIAYLSRRHGLTERRILQIVKAQG